MRCGVAASLTALVRIAEWSCVAIRSSKPVLGTGGTDLLVEVGHVLRQPILCSGEGSGGEGGGERDVAADLGADEIALPFVGVGLDRVREVVEWSQPRLRQDRVKAGVH